MRKLFFVASAFLISHCCYAVGPESCSLAGRINGSIVNLEYIDDSGYGTTKYPEYGYCLMGAMENESWFMTCSAKKGEAPKIRYETSRADNIPSSKAGEYARITSTYICRSGCSARVVKKFRLECNAGC
jgi:hypothetical protein